MDSRAFRAWKRTLYNAVGEEIKRAVEYYAVKSGQLGDHIYEKQKRILTCTTEEEARKLYEKLMEGAITMNAISLWMDKKAGGPPRNRFSETAAKKAEGLADFLDRRGDEDGAESQRRRAERIRKEAKARSDH